VTKTVKDYEEAAKIGMQAMAEQKALEKAAATAAPAPVAAPAPASPAPALAPASGKRKRQSRKSSKSKRPSRNRAASSGNDTLAAKGVLQSGQSLTKGKLKLTLQGDGNLVLYYGAKALWSTKTKTKSKTKLVMQGDGNLVVYAGSKVLWSTKTNGKSAVKLVLQNDCNLVLYSKTSKAVWDTKTKCPSGSKSASGKRKRRSGKSRRAAKVLEEVQQRLLLGRMGEDTWEERAPPAYNAAPGFDLEMSSQEHQATSDMGDLVTRCVQVRSFNSC
jgi:hypothetical protein